MGLFGQLAKLGKVTSFLIQWFAVLGIIFCQILKIFCLGDDSKNVIPVAYVFENVNFWNSKQFESSVVLSQGHLVPINNSWIQPEVFEKTGPRRRSSLIALRSMTSKVAKFFGKIFQRNFAEKSYWNLPNILFPTELHPKNAYYRYSACSNPTDVVKVSVLVIAWVITHQ